MPAAEDQVVWHHPVPALDDGDGIAAVDGHNVTDPDEVSEVGNHDRGTATGERLRGIEREIEVASLSLTKGTGRISRASSNRTCSLSIFLASASPISPWCLYATSCGREDAGASWCCEPGH